MARCMSCNYPLPDDRERVGARCPECHDTIYEPPTRFARPVRAGEASCAVHTGMESVGTCARCGNYVCETCRTRWRGQVWCAACVNRALESGEGTPEEARAHLRQALFSLGLGIVSWVIGFGGIALLALAGAQMAATGDPPLGPILLAMFILSADVLVAALGIGQATAALRARGDHMILATLGLIVSGLYVGAMLGIGTFGMWQD